MNTTSWPARAQIVPSFPPISPEPRIPMRMFTCLCGVTCGCETTPLGCEEDLIGVFGVDELSDLYDEPVLDAEYPGRVGLVDSSVPQLGPSRRLGEHPRALRDECARCERERSADVDLADVREDLRELRLGLHPRKPLNAAGDPVRRVIPHQGEDVRDVPGGEDPVEVANDSLVLFGSRRSSGRGSSLLRHDAPERRDCHEERKNS